MIKPFGGRRMPAPEASVCVRSNPMAPRASWKGYLKLSLVSCPIAPYPAAASSERVSFNRINKKSGIGDKGCGSASIREN